MESIKDYLRIENLWGIQKRYAGGDKNKKILTSLYHSLSMLERDYKGLYNPQDEYIMEIYCVFEIPIFKKILRKA